MGFLDNVFTRRAVRDNDQADLLRTSFREDMHAYEKALIETPRGSPLPITQEDVVDHLVEKVISEGVKTRVLVHVFSGLSGLECQLVERAMMRVQQTRGSHY